MSANLQLRFPHPLVLESRRFIVNVSHKWACKPPLLPCADATTCMGASTLTPTAAGDDSAIETVSSVHRLVLNVKPHTTTVEALRAYVRSHIVSLTGGETAAAAADVRLDLLPEHSVTCTLQKMTISDGDILTGTLTAVPKALTSVSDGSLTSVSSAPAAAPAAGATLTIVLEESAEQRLVFRVRATTLIRRVKTAYDQRRGLASYQTVLLYDGDRLVDLERSIESYGIQDGATLSVMLSMQGD